MRLLSLCHNLGAVQFGFVMQLLYKAYACEKMEGGNFLLPGYPVEAGKQKSLPPGSKIQVELADGTCLRTKAISTNIFHLSESVMTKLNVRAKPDFYYAVQVPDDFSLELETANLGIKVYLDDSTAS
jgi:hypothetical protein